VFAVTDSIENIFADSSMVSSSQPQDVTKDSFANRTVISSSPSQDVSREIELNLGTCAMPMAIHQNYQIIG
jgi:hypothetical protein